ncbi:hypothetical protein Tco_1029798 [Tanacetum coccineum]|uniref:Uncharacterized protein n=1 Tax=Tanacetum coccineum TaxID=301880 RepID=A0ABQ5G691_9ASTR
MECCRVEVWEKIRVHWPYLAHSVGVSVGSCSNPGKKHKEAVKWIISESGVLPQNGITFEMGNPALLVYTDSDMAGNRTT